MVYFGRKFCKKMSKKGGNFRCIFVMKILSLFVLKEVFLNFFFSQSFCVSLFLSHFNCPACDLLPPPLASGRPLLDVWPRHQLVQTWARWLCDPTNQRISTIGSMFFKIGSMFNVHPIGFGTGLIQGMDFPSLACCGLVGLGGGWGALLVKKTTKWDFLIKTFLEHQWSKLLWWVRKICIKILHWSRLTRPYSWLEGLNQCKEEMILWN